MTKVDEVPVRGSYPDPGLFALSGIDQMRAAFKRRSPRPPMSHLIGLMPTEASLGTATFTMPASPGFQSPAGLFLGGALAPVATGSTMIVPGPWSNVAREAQALIAPD